MQPHILHTLIRQNSSQRRSRRGSTFVLVMAFIVAGTAAIAISSQFVQSRFDVAQSAVYQQVALGALESVLTRRETSLIELAEQGDPAGFARMHNNYGEETFADCRVRWKIEPAIIRRGSLKSGEPTQEYITNPPPGFGAAKTDYYKLPNDFIYVYRISGEARYLPGGEAWDPSDPEDVLSRVQAVRYVAVNKRPVFRYVIFYAQEGPKGDLEMTHLSEFDVRGGVKSNGALYLGGSTLVNDYRGMNPDASTREATLLGKDVNGRNVHVDAVDGLFRLDKKTILGVINGYMQAGIVPSGLGGDGLTPTSEYDIDASVHYPGEGGANATYPKPITSSDIRVATYDGTIFHPKRIRTDALVTTTTEVRINENKILGVAGSILANDSRSMNWKTDALKPPATDLSAVGGFSGAALSRENGGNVLRLPETLGQRAFEPQRVEYNDYDGDPTYDEHELARPYFYHPSDGSLTTELPIIDDRIIEAPGRYLGYGIGEGLYLQRRSKSYYPSGYATPSDLGQSGDAAEGSYYNGWSVVTATGAEVGTNPQYATGSLGLVIRERPQPDETYHDAPEPTGEDGFYYMPYAYGKHTRTPIWPLWEMDIVSTRTDTNTEGEGDAGVAYTFRDYVEDYGDWADWDRTASRQYYSDGGHLRLQAAMVPGPDGIDDGDDSGHWYTNNNLESQNGWFDDTSGMQRQPHYYRENWRFFNMKRPKRDTTRTGLMTEWFNTRDLSRTPIDRAVRYINGDPATGRPAVSNSSKFSFRQVGFLRSAETGTHNFAYQVGVRDGMRVWIDGALVVDQWSWNASAVTRAGASLVLRQDTDYPIVIEYSDFDNGRNFNLQWVTPSMGSGATPVTIPRSALFPPLPFHFDLNEVDAVQMKVKSLNGPARQKGGLMIRPTFTPPSTVSNPVTVIEPPIVDPGDGTFVIEAEAFTSKDAGTGTFASYEWQTVSHTDASGGLYMQVPALPYANADESTGHRGPRLKYRMTFTTPGTYYVWTRIRCVPGSWGGTNSLYLGFNGVAFTDDATVQYGFEPPASEQWGWTPSYTSGNPATITIPATATLPATFELFMQMRESGLMLDKFIVTKRNPLPSPQNLDNGKGPIPTAGGFGPAYNVPVSGSFSESAAAVGHIGDGRDPFLFLGYSPERGVFMQYRGAAARSAKTTVTTWFIGSTAGAPADPGTGESYVNAATGETGYSPASLPSPRTVTVAPSKLTPFTQPVSQTVHDGTVLKGVHSFQEKGPGLKSASGVNGQGNNFTMYYYEGPIERRALKRWELRYRERGYVPWRFTLSGTRDNPSGQIFLPYVDNADLQISSEALSDYGKEFTIFNGVTGGSAIWSPLTSNRMFSQGSPNTEGNRLWWIDADKSDGDGWYGNYIEHYFAAEQTFAASYTVSGQPTWDYSNPPNYKGPAKYSSNWQAAIDAAPGSDPFSLVGATTYGNSATIWHFRDGRFMRKDAGGYTYVGNNGANYLPYRVLGSTTVYYTDNGLETGTFDPVTFKADLLSAAPSVHSAANYSGHPGWPAVPDAERPSQPTLSAFDYESIYDWKDIIAAHFGLSLSSPQVAIETVAPRTFSLKRERAFYSDLNSYVSRFGHWFATGVEQWIPWPTWALDLDTFDPPQYLPFTGSIRPDLWTASKWGSGQAKPNKALRQAGGYSGVVPINGNARLDPSYASSVRWKDDIVTWTKGGANDRILAGRGGELWLRFERVLNTDTFKLLYYFGSAVTPDWEVMRDQAGAEIHVNCSLFGNEVLIGPALQSGKDTQASDLRISDLRIEFDNLSAGLPADDFNVLDHRDWESPDGGNGGVTARYMASQYQAFFGPYEITEDFFNYYDTHGDLTANEVWIYNTRDFQSQSRWWASGAEKEDTNNDGAPEVELLYPTTTLTRSARELLAKQTLLSLNMRSVQNYLKSRTLTQATADVIDGGYNGTRQLSLASAPLLKDVFNGLIYAARTNRYPWNPNIDPAAQNRAVDGQGYSVARQEQVRGANPWTWPLEMPNWTRPSIPYSGAQLLAEVNRNLRRGMYEELLYDNWQSYSPTTPIDEVHGGTQTRLVDVNAHPANALTAYDDPVNRVPNTPVGQARYARLQPYDLANAPAFKPQEWTHGVRITHAAAIDWGLPNSASGEPLSSVPEFGASKSIIVTPNQLMVQGDLNVATYSAKVDDIEVSGKWTPLAIVGDTVSLLSNAWDDVDWQEPGLIVDWDPVSGVGSKDVKGGGTLFIPFGGDIPDADETSYYASVITHNLPTTKRSVRDGEAASVMNNFLYLEDWLWTGAGVPVQQDMFYKGSLVVMDSRRHSNAYYLDVPKWYGNSPWGTMGWHRWQGYHEDRLQASYASTGDASLTWGDGTDTSAAKLREVFRAPSSNYDFNDDLLTSAGTPPFTPFGVTSSGVGNYVNILK